MHSIFYYETPIGSLSIAENGKSITHIGLSRSKQPSSMDFINRETILIKEAKRQLDEYFQGNRTRFTLPLLPIGTPFQMKVWNALLQIPYGETRTYKQIAGMVHSPKGFRAVGMANNRNPISIMIPCHRVIGSNGDLVGYAGGLERKKTLLEIEGILK